MTLCEHVHYEVDLDGRSGRGTGRLTRTKVACDQPGVMTLERHDITYPQHAGPIWVCEKHAEWVRSQNEINNLMAWGEIRAEAKLREENRDV